MSDPFIGQVCLFGSNFAPRGWALCDGQLLPISQNSALYSILGTTYGGDGRTTFGLPGLRGRVAVGEGTGAGLSSYRLGQRGGSETHTLSEAEMPVHTHAQQASTTGAETPDPAGALPAAGPTAAYRTGGADAALASSALGSAGSGQSHDNMQPFLAVNYIIALVGTYPSRT